MARAERRRPAVRQRRFGWWWLALPALSVAAYAAFAATLSLLGDDGVDAPPSLQEPSRPVPQPAAAVPPAAATAADVVTAPAAAPPPDAAPAAGASVAPEPSPSPAAQRAAADGTATRKVKPKRAPQEHLTEQDRRALDALVEQAGKNAR